MTTLSKQEKIQKMVDDWDRFKTMTQDEIGAELGVAGRTIYVWREQLRKRGIDLDLKVGGRSDSDIFSKIKK